MSLGTSALGTRPLGAGPAAPPSGGVVPTLSLPTAINITASSFQPRVSYAY